MASHDAHDRWRPSVSSHQQRDQGSDARPTARDLAGPFHYLAWLTRSQGKRIVLGALLGIAWMLGLTVPPWVLARVVDDGFVARDPAAVVGWALVLLTVSVLIALLSIGRHRTMTKVRMDAAFRSVRAIVWHTSRLGASLPRRISAGDVVTTGIADVYTVAMALTVTGPGVGAVVAYVVVGIVLFTTSPLLAIVVLAGVPLLAIAVGPFLQRIERAGDAYRVEQGRLTTRLVDALAGLGVLNGLGGKTFIASRYEQQSRAVVGHGYRVAGPTSWVGALASGLPALFLAAVVWLSARMAAEGSITIGEVVAVHGYVAVLVVPVAAFIEGAGDIARARVAARRIIGLLALPVASHDRSSSVEIPADAGPLTDPESGVVIRPGLLTALVAVRPNDAHRVVERLGHTGAEPETEVSWAGVRIDDADRAMLRSRLLVADNDAELFAGTVRDVIAGRLDPDDDRIARAVYVAVADDIVEALPHGLDSAIAAGGRDLSGGQRQRICLARAVYAAPEILLAIEPTSAVDANTEVAMIERLREARRGMTTVVTTMSPLVLAQADEVIVLVDDRANSIGTHADLLHSQPSYRGLMSRSQGGGDD